MEPQKKLYAVYTYANAVSPTDEDPDWQWYGFTTVFSTPDAAWKYVESKKDYDGPSISDYDDDVQALLRERGYARLQSPESAYGGPRATFASHAVCIQFEEGEELSVKMDLEDTFSTILGMRVRKRR